MYKYSLDKKSTKHICPKCLKKRLVLYVDNDNGTYISNKVGRCDREINCGYHFTPSMYFQENNIEYNPISQSKAVGNKTPPPSYHSYELVEATLETRDSNNFIYFLNTILKKEQVDKIIDLYYLGTTTFWNNSTVFWQIDIENKVRAGKMIMYKKTGKRTKYINWVHSELIKRNHLSNYNLKQCFFGEHLLNQYQKKTIALVESEKTACLMSQFFDKYLWLSTGSLTGLKIKKMDALKDRKIILYPDLGISKNNITPYQFWSKRCEEFKALGFDISISDLLEKKATEEQRKSGFDIADYFIENQSKIPLQKRE